MMDSIFKKGLAMFARFKKDGGNKQLKVPAKNAYARDSQDPTVPSDEATSHIHAESLNWQRASQAANGGRLVMPDSASLINSYLPQIIELLLNHPLLIPALVTELEKRGVLKNELVQECCRAFEAKYDITPTQIYRDKISEAQMTLATINQQVQEKTAHFEELKTSVLDLQKISIEAYREAMEKITQQLLDKIKL